MKRIFLFVATNIAVIAVMTIVLSLLGVNRFLTGSGLNLPMLLVFSAVVGFTGSIFSLLISKPMAKWSTGARVIDNPSSSTELWLVNTVRQLAERAGIGMPGRTLGRPPSTRKVEPVMKEAACESRNTMAAETSASVPKRFIGTVCGNARMVACIAGG